LADAQRNDDAAGVVTGGVPFVESRFFKASNG
jgi:hypothetical protein